MRTIIESINNRIDEARLVDYRVSFIGPVDDEDAPFTVTISVDKENQKSFEKYLEDEQDNTFAHVDGGNIEY